MDQSGSNFQGVILIYGRMHIYEISPMDFFLPAVKPAGLCFTNVLDFLLGDNWLAVVLAVILALVVVLAIAVVLAAV